MVRYVIKRILMFIPVMIAVAVVIFTILYFVPGDPVAQIAGDSATELELEALRESLGFNDPYIVQLGRYLKSVFLEFDFGSSYITNVNITEELMVRLPRTLKLGLLTWLFTIVVGIPLGVIAGVNQNRLGDRISMLIALFGVSMPQFWVGLMLVLLFSLHLGILPSSGMGGIKYLIMPVIAGSLGDLAQNARQTRSAMLEVIRSDYVITAKAKGLSQRKVIWKHALPNALIPVIATSGDCLAHCFAGSVVIETVFGYPGIGLYMVKAVGARDYPIVEGCVLMLAVSCAAVMLLIDVVYGFIDPKIKARYVTKKGRKS